jgi:hypothetical protein
MEAVLDDVEDALDVLNRLDIEIKDIENSQKKKTPLMLTSLEFFRGLALINGVRLSITLSTGISESELYAAWASLGMLLVRLNLGNSYSHSHSRSKDISLKPLRRYLCIVLNTPPRPTALIQMNNIGDKKSWEEGIRLICELVGRKKVNFYSETPTETLFECLMRDLEILTTTSSTF